MQELIYTSAPQGLKSGSRGFCTVAATRDLPRNLADRLESLSGYRHVYDASDQNAASNPVAYSQLLLTVAGEPYYILSRIADAGLDYTQRSNKLAHHLVLNPNELPPGGPAWLLEQPGVVMRRWEGEPRTLDPRPALPQGSESVGGICRAWQQQTGDAGWGGALAETLLEGRQAAIIFPIGAQPLPLIAESIRLLPAPLRWKVSFHTYFSKLPPGIECRWRCILDGTPEAKAARADRQALVLDLTRPLDSPKNSAWVQYARTGVQDDVSALRLDRASDLASAAGRASGLSAERLTANRTARLQSAKPGIQPVPQEQKQLRTVAALAAVLVLLLGAAALVPRLLAPDHPTLSLPSKADSALKTENAYDRVLSEARSAAKALSDSMNRLQLRTRDLSVKVDQIANNRSASTPSGLHRAIVNLGNAGADQTVVEQWREKYRQVQSGLDGLVSQAAALARALDEAQASLQQFSGEHFVKAGKGGGRPIDPELATTLLGTDSRLQDSLRSVRGRMDALSGELSDVQGRLTNEQTQLKHADENLAMLEKAGRRSLATGQTVIERPEAPLDLHEIDLPLPNALSGAPKPVSFGHIYIKDSAACELTLQGGKLDRGELCLAEARSTPDQRIWKIVLKTPKGGLGMIPDQDKALLALRGQELTFQWLPSRGPIGLQITNCLLQATVGKHVSCLALRKPVVLTDELDLLHRPALNQECSIRVFPLNGATRLEIAVTGISQPFHHEVPVLSSSQWQAYRAAHPKAEEVLLPDSNITWSVPLSKGEDPNDEISLEIVFNLSALSPAGSTFRVTANVRAKDPFKDPNGKPDPLAEFESLQTVHRRWSAGLSEGEDRIPELNTAVELQTKRLTGAENQLAKLKQDLEALAEQHAALQRQLAEAIVNQADQQTRASRSFALEQKQQAGNSKAKQVEYQQKVVSRTKDLLDKNLAELARIEQKKQRADAWLNRVQVLRRELSVSVNLVSSETGATKVELVKLSARSKPK